MSSLSFRKYIGEISKLLSNTDEKSLNQIFFKIKSNLKKKSTIYLVGNGGSSSICNHVSVDFNKAAKIKSSTFNNSNLITCYANDYGHENWVREAIASYVNKDDILIFVSSSGNSKNIINAAKYCIQKKISFYSFTGFDLNNELNLISENFIHVNSKNYNYVEMTHHIQLLYIVDKFIFEKT